MFIEALARYYRQKGGSGVLPFYRVKEIHWIVNLDLKGKLLSVEKPEKKAKMQMPRARRSSDILPFLLSDNAIYTFGVIGKENIGRSRRMHQAYVAAVKRCAQETADPFVEAVALYLGKVKGPPNPAMKPFDNIVFYVGGAPVCTREKVVGTWAESQGVRLAGEIQECLCCGELKPGVRCLPETLTNIPGSDDGVAVLMTANQPATWSWGRKQTETSALCFTCANAFTKGGQMLLEDTGSHLKLGQMILVYWPSQVERMPPVHQLLTRPTAENLKLLQDPDLWPQDVIVYFLGLSGRKTRGIVKLAQPIPADVLRRRLETWFGLMDDAVSPLVGYCDEKDRWQPGLFNVLTRSGKTMEANGQHVITVLDALLNGRSLPRWLLTPLIRAQAPWYNASRALVHLVDGANMLSAEDRVARDCGRLLGRMEKAQIAASPGGRKPNRSLADRILAQASRRPAAVLGPELIRLRSRLSKLERNGPSYHSRALDDIMKEIGEMPEHLTAAQVAHFAMGYYEISLERRVKKENGNGAEPTVADAPAPPTEVA